MDVLGSQRRACIHLRCIRFRRESRDRRTRVSPSVMEELKNTSACIPLFKAKLSSPWLDKIWATGEPLCGRRVCVHRIDHVSAASIGSRSEKWRFEIVDAYHARHQAMSSSIINESKNNDIITSPHNPNDIDLSDLESCVSVQLHEFVGGPRKMRRSTLWKVVHDSRRAGG